MTGRSRTTYVELYIGVSTTAPGASSSGRASPGTTTGWNARISLWRRRRGSGAILLEPAEDVGHLRHHIAGLCRDVVRRIGETHHRGRHLSQLERLIELLGFRARRAVIDLTRYEHRRRRHVTHVRDRRTLHVLIEILPWES